MTTDSPRRKKRPRQSDANFSSDRRPQASWSLRFLAALAAIAALHVARDILIPIVLAVILSLLLRPIFRRLQRLRVPDVLASFVLVLAVGLVFLGGLLTVARQGQAWLAQVPQTLKRLEAMVPQREGVIGDLSKTAEAVREMTIPNAALPVVVHSAETTITALGVSGHFIAAAALVLVLAFFLLSFSDSLLKQAVESRDSFGEKRNLVALIQNVQNGVSRYLATVTIINGLLGAITGISMWALGMPNPALWGVLAATLNYVPHVGAFLCMVVLFVVGAVSHESLSYATAVALVFSCITTVESYLATPFALSKSLQLSPLAVILSIVFWSWLWGIPGALLAAPLLAMIKVAADQVESLQPLGLALAEPK